jgi:GcrA cell cycle regulator
MADTDWTQAKEDELRALWAEGHSTAQIGARMGLTKNAVVGKAHRLDLPSRPSPIKARGGDPIVRAPRVTLPPMQDSARSMRDSAPTMHVPVPAAPPPPPVVTFKPFAFRSCCWPLWGNQERPTHRYCGAAVMMKRDGTPAPYCAEHHQKGTVRLMHPVTAPRRAA